jgi:hypothetical protein
MKLLRYFAVALSLLIGVPALAQSSRAQLTSQVNAAITTNGKGQITGATLQTVLDSMIASMVTLEDAINSFTGTYYRS